MKEFWEERFANSEYIYGTAPNVFIREQLEKMKPGTGLFPAEGEGRNAVFAAQQGWQAQCYDYSKNARKKALHLAAAADVTIGYQIADLSELSLPGETYDAAFFSFMHLPPDIRTHVHRNILNSLKPGGKVVMEVYHKKQLKYHTGGPGHPDMLYSRQVLEKDFEQGEISYYNEAERRVNEGRYHTGRSFTIRAVFTRK